MELSITTVSVGAFLLVLMGFLGGCGYYSWENHYKFRKRGSSEFEIGLRFGETSPPQFEYFGVQAINDLLTKGARVLSAREGVVLARQTGMQGETGVMQWTGFTVKFDVTKCR